MVLARVMGVVFVSVVVILELVIIVELLVEIVMVLVGMVVGVVEGVGGGSGGGGRGDGCFGLGKLPCSACHCQTERSIVHGCVWCFWAAVQKHGSFQSV